MAKKTEEKKDKLEREYIIPLRRKWKHVPRYKRTNKAVKTVKEFLARHMKIRDRDLKKIRIDRYLNEMLWFRGIRHPPIKIKVKAVKEGDIVRVELAELPEKLKFKKAREEKREEKAMEAVTKKKTLLERAKEERTKPEETKKEEEEAKEVEEKREEEKEKKAAVVEAGKQMEKAAAKKVKHQTGGKVKQPKHQIRKALEK